MRSSLAVLLGVATFGVAVSGPTLAQSKSYPTKPVRVLVGFAPGGGSDTLARLVGTPLGERLGQSMIIDNRPGGNGVIAMNLATNAQPDGYTLMVLSNSSVVSASLLTKVPYDVREAYSPISMIAVQPYVLTVSRTLPINTVKELIAHAKAQKGALNYGSSGQGSSAHLGMELFKHMAGVDITHIPYKGIGPAMVDLSTGQVQLLFASAVAAGAAARTGKVKPLAVGSRRRAEGLPDIPTVEESGLPGFELTGWFGLVGPAGLPADVVSRLNREVVSILSQPAVKARLANDGSEASPGSPAAFRKTMLSEIDRWAKLIKQANLNF